MLNTVFLFLNLGGGEIMLLLLVVVLLFGSDQLPQLVKGLGKGIREINDAKQHIQREIKTGSGQGLDDLQKQAADIKQEFSKVQNTVQRNVNGMAKVVTTEVEEVAQEVDKKSKENET